MKKAKFGFDFHSSKKRLNGLSTRIFSKYGTKGVKVQIWGGPFGSMNTSLSVKEVQQLHSNFTKYLTARELLPDIKKVGDNYKEAWKASCICNPGNGRGCECGEEARYEKAHEELMVALNKL